LIIWAFPLAISPALFDMILGNPRVTCGLARESDAQADGTSSQERAPWSAR
jgi:hypothetical protein